jgi:hypothetical protein
MNMNLTSYKDLEKDEFYFWDVDGKHSYILQYTGENIDGRYKDTVSHRWFKLVSCSNPENYNKDGTITIDRITRYMIQGKFKKL